MRRTIAALVAFGLLTVACTSGDGGSTTSTTTSDTTRTTAPGVVGIADRFDPDEIRFVAALERFDACDAVLDHFRTEAMERVGPYGLNGGGGFFPQPMFFDDVAVAREEAMAGDGDFAATTTVAAAAPALVGGDEFSGTNTQVVGVDEPDIVKTDGERIVTVVNGRVSVVDADEGRLLGTLFLGEGWDHRLFLRGDRLFVFSNGGEIFPVEPLAGDVAASPIVPPGYNGPTTTIHEIDITEPLEMDIVRTMRVEGRFLSARSIDGTVRVVISSFPANLPFVFPSTPAAEDVAEETNRRIVAESTLDTWLPDFVLTDGEGEVLQRGLAVACDRMHRPAEFAGFDTLSVLTLDLESGLTPGNGTAVIAQGETVYASTESLYVATNVWVPQELVGDGSLDDFSENYETALHKFSIAGDGPADYEASGSIEGHLLNQFSLDEHDGYLRVAVTDGPPWGFRDSSESYVRVLEQQGDRLVEVGAVGDMGKGERIFSVRFVGDTAYVVTFRQTDPFYVVDLSDPDDPTVAGELKIPGYSAYLHPIGDGLVLGVGQDADEDGRTRGTKVSLFDVDDPETPLEVDVWTLPSGSSEVEWNHLAFLWWAPERAAVLPVQDWRNDFYGAVVLDVEETLDERGRVSHDDPKATIASDCERIDDEDLQQWVSEEGMIIQVCGERDAGGYGSFGCEVMPAEEGEFFLEEFVVGSVETVPGDRIEVCWPHYGGGDPIIRSLVIGDTLWTLSWRVLQANDLGSLERLDRVNIG